MYLFKYFTIVIQSMISPTTAVIFYLSNYVLLNIARFIILTKSVTAEEITNFFLVASP